MAAHLWSHDAAWSGLNQSEKTREGWMSKEIAALNEGKRLTLISLHKYVLQTFQTIICGWMQCFPSFSLSHQHTFFLCSWRSFSLTRKHTKAGLDHNVVFVSQHSDHWGHRANQEVTGQTRKHKVPFFCFHHNSFGPLMLQRLSMLSHFYLTFLTVHS